MDKHFNLECLDEHNQLRRLHGCPPLRLSKSLAEEAQYYAEKMAREDFFEHSECTDYGENLITRKGPRGVVLTGKVIPLHLVSDESGHFCQVVWKDTQKAGFGVARSKDGRSIYVVGRYKRPGNYLDNYRENVPPPLNGLIYVPTDEELSKPILN
ncbi:unnamed protein product [Rodentolepis nana]|uniref:SCP domain-containing protein n=1 Tax=Rodentolepis nana TaxID=102285 RepID=A0A0R3TXT8_RODNA|nr:unnamed protein product [Rodentolepis nana]